MNEGQISGSRFERSNGRFVGGMGRGRTSMFEWRLSAFWRSKLLAMARQPCRYSVERSLDAR